MQTLKQLETELRESSILRDILLALRNGPKNFNPLCEELGVHPSTLSKYLRRAEREGLVEHKKKFDSYKITQRGSDSLRMLETKPVDKFIIECVKGGAFAGSIIFRVPKKFAQDFDRLYQPRPLEGLNRALFVAFTFWLNRYGGGIYSENTDQRTGGTIACGHDFNNDKIWDLTMYETPASGYPNIKKALKKGIFMLNGKKVGLHSDNLWMWCLNSLEERLSKAQF